MWTSQERISKGAGILDSEIVNVNLEGATLLDRDVRDSRSAVLALADSVKGESRQELLKYAEEIAHKNETFFYWLRGQITQSDTSGCSLAGAIIGWFGFSRTIIKKDNPVGIEGAVLDKRRGTDVVTLNPEGKGWINLPERCVGATTLLTLEA